MNILLYKPFWILVHTFTFAGKSISLGSQVNRLAAVSTCVLLLIGLFTVQSHLSRKPLLPLIPVPFAQSASYLTHLQVGYCKYNHLPLPLQTLSMLCFPGLEHVLGLKEGRPCSSGYRPQMWIIPLMRTVI